MGRKNRERETNEKEKKDIVSWFSLFIAIISMFVSVWSANESTKIAKTDRRVDTYTKAIVSLDTLSFREWITEEGYGEIFNGEVDDQWVKTRMEMNLAREWYLVGTPYCGDLEYVRARIPE